jgi:uncharacterized protein
MGSIAYSLNLDNSGQPPCAGPTKIRSIAKCAGLRTDAFMPFAELRNIFVEGRRRPEGTALNIQILVDVLGVALIAIGLLAAMVPALPGIPLIFGGIWLIAAVDQYLHIGLWWLVGIALIGAVALVMDFLAGVLGAKRAGASQRAVWGALLGTVVGLFFGLPGVLLGPFFGAVLGELAAGNSILRSTHVGVSAWVGLIFGTIIKLVASVTMVALFGFAWWWNRIP